MTSLAGMTSTGMLVTYPFLRRGRDKKGYADVDVMPTEGRGSLVGAVVGLHGSA